MAEATATLSAVHPCCPKGTDGRCQRCKCRADGLGGSLRPHVPSSSDCADAIALSAREHPRVLSRAAALYPGQSRRLWSSRDSLQGVPAKGAGRSQDLILGAFGTFRASTASTLSARRTGAGSRPAVSSSHGPRGGEPLPRRDSAASRFQVGRAMSAGRLLSRRSSRHRRWG